MTCHHIPSVRCPECADDRPSMGYWPTTLCGTCAALRKENAQLCDVLAERNRSLCEWQDTARNEMAGRAAAEAEVARQAALVQKYHPAYLGLPHVVRERGEARAKLARVVAILETPGASGWRNNPQQRIEAALAAVKGE